MGAALCFAHSAAPVQHKPPAACLESSEDRTRPDVPAKSHFDPKQTSSPTESPLKLCAAGG
jgi:hypothetical protein